MGSAAWLLVALCLMLTDKLVTSQKSPSSLCALVPDFKLSITVTAVAFPLSFSDDRVPVRDQNSLSAEDVLKKHTLKGMIPLQSWTDAASIPERRRGKRFTSRKGAALERALEGPRQQVGL